MTAGVGITLLAAVSNSAFSQDQNGVVRRCLSIADVNERVDCLETGVLPTTTTAAPANQTKQSRETPSFDCRAAQTIVERAICNDPALSAWDARLGRLFQQTLQATSDRASLLNNQRLWLIQRDQSCGSLANSVVAACLIEITKSRISALAQSTSPKTESGAAVQSSQSAASSTARSYAELRPSTPTPNRNEARSPTPQMDSSKPPPQQQVSQTTFATVSILLGIVLIIGTHRYLAYRRRQIAEQARLDEEQERLEAHIQRLVQLFGEDEAARILAHQVWQGMTEAQLLESRGPPSDVDHEIIRQRTRETWKYGQVGRNRFSERVYLENGIVIGWKN